MTRWRYRFGLFIMSLVTNTWIRSIDMDGTVKSQVRHLYEIEGLTRRQIAGKLGMCRNRAGKIIAGEQMICSYHNLPSCFSMRSRMSGNPNPVRPVLSIFSNTFTLFSAGTPGTLSQMLKTYSSPWSSSPNLTLHTLPPCFIAPLISIR